MYVVFRLSPTVLVDYVPINLAISLSFLSLDTPINLAISLSFRLSPTVLVDYVDTPINLAISLSPIESHCACRLRRSQSGNLSLLPIESHCACRLRRYAYQSGNLSLSFRLSPTVLVDYVDTPINLAISQSDTREGISLRRPAYSSASKLFIPFFVEPGTRAHCEESYSSDVCTHFYISY